MALSKLGGVGYLLSAFIAIVLALTPSFFFLASLLSIVLFAHPVSIVLRFLGWRRVGKLIEHRYIGIQPYPFIAIGLAYFGLLISGFSGSILDGSPYIVASLWAAYSLLEAGGYVTLARSGIKPFYVSLLNIPAVGLILASLSFLDLGALISDGAPAETLVLGMLTAGLAILAASALSSSYALLRWGAISPRLERRPAYAELETMAPTREQAPVEAYVATRAPPRPARVRQERPPAPRNTAVQRRRGIAIQVLSRGEAMSCRRCGSFSPIGSHHCSTCGSSLYEDAPGLKCPVCGAPLSIATKLSPEHRVCGVCFSDLRLSASV